MWRSRARSYGRYNVTETSARRQRKGQAMNEQIPAQTAEPTAPSIFSVDELHALQALRDGHNPGLDLFAPAELAHLQFARWLYDTGLCAS